MVDYKTACDIAKKELRDYFKEYDSVTVTEIDEGWVFLFGKTGVKLTPAPQRLISKTSGEIRCFPIPPISNLKKLQNGKEIDFIE